MPKATALSKIVREAKRIRKRHPHKFDRLNNPWRDGYVAEASASYKKSKKKKEGKAIAGKRKPRKRKAKAKAKAKPPKISIRKRSSSVTVTGRKKKQRRSAPKKKVGRAGRRSVSGFGGGSGLLLGLAVGVGAYLLLSKGTTQQTYPTSYSNLPPLQQTQNYTRNTQSQDLLNYAMTAGLAVEAIISLIDRLNKSSDSQVSEIHNDVYTTGDIGAWV